MKKTILLLSSALLLMSATCKRAMIRPVVYIKDCTGAYLRYSGKDYHICNTEKTGGFSNGDTVLVSFNRLKTCNGSANNGIICMMYHANEGWIEVLNIKRKQ